MTHHQAPNSVKGDIFNLYVYENTSFRGHFHKSPELIFVDRGEASVSVRGEDFSVPAGQYLLVLPYEVHSFAIPVGSRAAVLVFSGSTVPAFLPAVGDRQAENPVFSCPAELTSLFRASVLSGYSSPVTSLAGDADRLFAKGYLYLICSEFLRRVKWISKSRKNDLLLAILDYIEAHFRENISVESLARALGFSDRYLSRFLNEAMNTHFKELVNQYRFEYAEELLRSSDRPMAEIAFESGFQSVRSFNRVYRALAGSAPRRERGESAAEAPV